MRKNIILNKDGQYYGEGMLKFLVLTFHQQRNCDTKIKIHSSEKNIFVRVDASAIYRAKISLDLSIFTTPHTKGIYNICLCYIYVCFSDLRLPCRKRRLASK